MTSGKNGTLRPLHVPHEPTGVFASQVNNGVEPAAAAEEHVALQHVATSLAAHVCVAHCPDASGVEWHIK